MKSICGYPSSPNLLLNEIRFMYFMETTLIKNPDPTQELFTCLGFLEKLKYWRLNSFVVHLLIYKEN